jgi:uncharacterized membrane protein
MRMVEISTQHSALGKRQSAIRNQHSAIMRYVPQFGSNRRPLTMWFVVAAGSLVVMALIIAAPVALANGHTAAAQVIYQAFGHVCHQIPERSFFIDGHPFAVCSRCTGIYAGFLAAIMGYPVARSLRQMEAPARKWLFIAAAPLVVDFSLEVLGIWHNTHYSRLATGTLLGAVVVFYIMPGLLDLSLRTWRGKRGPSLPETASENSTAPVFSGAASSTPSDYSAPHRRI